MLARDSARHPYIQGQQPRRRQRVHNLGIERPRDQSSDDLARARQLASRRPGILGGLPGRRGSDWVSLRRAVGSRNRPLLRSPRGRAEIFPGRGRFLVPASPALCWCPPGNILRAPGRPVMRALPARRLRLTAGRATRRPDRLTRPSGHDSWQFLDCLRCADSSPAADPAALPAAGPAERAVAGAWSFPPASACPSARTYPSLHEERLWPCPSWPAAGEPGRRSSQPDGLAWGPQPAYMVAVGPAPAHPGNVREDLYF